MAARRASLITLLLLCLGSAPAQEKQTDLKPKPIDKNTLELWTFYYDHEPQMTLPSGPSAFPGLSITEKGRKSGAWVSCFRRNERRADNVLWPNVHGPLPDPGVPFALVMWPPNAKQRDARDSASAMLSRLVDFENLVYLDVGWVGLAGLEDKHLEEIGALEGLTHLDLGPNNTIHGSGLKHLAPLKKLTYLNLSGTSVSGGWLRSLKGLPALETLVLDHIREFMTDDGLKGLKDLRQLKHLSLMSLGASKPATDGRFKTSQG